MHISELISWKDSLLQESLINPALLVESQKNQLLLGRAETSLFC